MSLDELRADLKRNMEEARRLTNVSEIRDHLLNTLWPYLEAKLETIDEIDEAVAELVDHEEDYLQPETAAVFAAVVQTGLQLGEELKKRVIGSQVAHDGNAEILAAIVQHQQLCEQAVAILGEITMVAPEGDEEDPDAEAEEDDDE